MLDGDECMFEARSVVLTDIVEFAGQGKQSTRLLDLNRSLCSIWSRIDLGFERRAPPYSHR